jgi:hypothetical protein
MTFRFRQRPAVALNCTALALAVLVTAPAAHAATYPITPAQRSTAQQVASKGVPLSELAPNAPDSYTVKKGDTLWAISKVFLKSPWRWPELWGMNLDQIRNPHLIYPGQLLVLEKIDGMARLKLGQSIGDGGTVKLSPSIRSDSSESGAIASVPMNLIAPFLNDALVFETNEMLSAPRIAATQEDHVVLGRGDLAYVLGDVGKTRSWQIFRAPKALVDPETKQVIGYEARYVGSAEHVADGETRPGAQAGKFEVPSTFRITSTREDAGVGDRLAPATVRDFAPFVPHSPPAGMTGTVISLYGDALSAASNQIVAINRGSQDGIERGNVLGLWHEGGVKQDASVERGVKLKIPDRRIGTLFVFRVFNRVSYALVLDATEPTVPGDRLSAP